MGLDSRQCVVVVAPCRVVDTSRPLDTAVRAFGAVIRRSNVALSEGWSLPGNQVDAESGSPATRTPSEVLSQP